MTTPSHSMGTCHQTLGQWVECSFTDPWGVWIHERFVIAAYDGAYTTFDRVTGRRLYHGMDVSAAVAVTYLPGDTLGEVYAAAY